MDLSFSLKDQKIELEKSLYKKKKLEEKIERRKQKGLETFLTEKALEKLEIKIVKQVTGINGTFV